MASDTISARPALSNDPHSTPLFSTKTLSWDSAPMCPSSFIAADTISARPATSNDPHSTPLFSAKALAWVSALVCSIIIEAADSKSCVCSSVSLSHASNAAAFHYLATGDAKFLLLCGVSQVWATPCLRLSHPLDWQTSGFTLRRKGQWHEGKTAVSQLSAENSWFDNTTDNVNLIQSWGYNGLDSVKPSVYRAVVCLKFGRPPVSACLTLMSSLQEEQIPGENLTICHRTMIMQGPGLLSRSSDLPIHLSGHWRHAPQSRTEICYGHGWCCVPHGETKHDPLIWLYYCPWNALRIPETCPSRLDCDWCCALGQIFTLMLRSSEKIGMILARNFMFVFSTQCLQFIYVLLREFINIASFWRSFIMTWFNIRKSLMWWSLLL